MNQKRWGLFTSFAIVVYGLTVAGIAILAFLYQDALLERLITGDPYSIFFVVLVDFSVMLFLGVLVIVIRYESRFGLQRIQRQLLWGSLAIHASLAAALPPLASHDIFYYAGFGRAMVVHEADPYQTPLRSLEQGDPVIQKIPGPWKDHTAYYGPLSLAPFAVAVKMSGDELLTNIHTLKMMWLVVYFVGVILMLRVFVLLNHPLATSVVWGICASPVMLWYLLVDGHNEVLLLPLLCLSLILLNKQRWLWAALVVGCMAAVKVTSAVLIPVIVLYIWSQRRHPLDVGPTLGFLGCFMAVFALPRFLLGGAEIPGVLGLAEFSLGPWTMGAVNALLFKVGEVLSPASQVVLLQWVTWASGGVFWLTFVILTAIFLWRRSHGFDMLVGGMLILSMVFFLTRPYFQPWYIVWILPLLLLTTRSPRAVEQAFILALIPLGGTIWRAPSEVLQLFVVALVIGSYVWFARSFAEKKRCQKNMVV